MKKHRGLKITIIILSVLAVLVAAGFIWLQLSEKNKDSEKMPGTSFAKNVEAEEQIEALTEEFDEVAVDEETGLVYVNNELLLIVDQDMEHSAVESLLEGYGCYIADATMGDYGIYQVKMEKQRTLEELEDLVYELESQPNVDTVSIMPVSLMDSDIEPVYPKDPWNGAKWDVENPQNENWGAEAVRAPLAWANFDELGAVNVGLIDSMPDMTHEDLIFADAYVSYSDDQVKEWSTESVDNSSYAADDHGTHVAGIMAAVWNEKGMSGLMGNKFNLYYSAAFHGNSTSSYYTPYTYVKAISVLLENDVQAINISQNTGRQIGFAASKGNEAAIAYLQQQADVAEVMLSRIVRQRNKDGRPDFVICISAGNSNNTEYYENESSAYGYSSSGNGKKVIGGSMAQYNNFLALIDEPSVSGRIVVVGAVGRLSGNNGNALYRYSDFSCVGDRVDIAAPGESIYSCVVNSYNSFGGTSMAAPHVTATAGLLFAANEYLTGPEVKTILCASTYDRFFYEGGNCGLLDMNLAIQRAIESRENSVNRVVGTSETNGLDICFLIDTTGSMGDDIENARQNMHSILDSIAGQTSDYRVAIVDYRDFSSRTGNSDDYPAEVQLNFDSDRDTITAAIDGLSLGYGGDEEETVYSGFAKALTLDWRYNANKVIIVLGDAPPLDPEPETGYTYESVLMALYNADIGIDPDRSDGRVLGDAEDSLISIYTIGTDASDAALDFFQDISDDTGGALTDVSDASEVSDAIVDSIEQIEVEPTQSVEVKLGKKFSNEIAEIYQDDVYLFSVNLDNRGTFTLQNMSIDSYQWEIPRLKREGSFQVEEGVEAAKVKVKDGGLVGYAYSLWLRNRTELFFGVEGVLVGIILLLVLILLVVSKLSRMPKKAVAANVGAAPAAAQNDPWEIGFAAPNPQEPKTPQVAADDPTRFCPCCGKAVPQNAAVCTFCNEKLK